MKIFKKIKDEKLEFIRKINIMISFIIFVEGETACPSYNFYESILNKKEYRYNNETFHYYLLWLHSNLKEMGYSEQEIIRIFEYDMPIFRENGLRLNKYYNGVIKNGDNRVFEIILVIFSLCLMWLCLPIKAMVIYIVVVFIYILLVIDHGREYNELENKLKIALLFKEEVNKCVKNKYQMFDIFDRYMKKL